MSKFPGTGRNGGGAVGGISNDGGGVGGISAGGGTGSISGAGGGATLRRELKDRGGGGSTAPVEVVIV